MKNFRWLALAFLMTLPLLSIGCATTHEADGVEVEIDFQGHGVKSFEISVEPLYQATLAALKNMNLKVDEITENGENRQVYVKTEELHIIIDLMEIGLKISKMRVKAQEAGFFSSDYNEEMAIEIIKETALVVEASGYKHY
jgi:preprotein translocase subunit SecF